MFKPNLEGVKKTLRDHPFPADIIVEVIARCNLRCIMCPQPNLRRTRGEMSPVTFKKIVDEVARESPSSRLWLALMGESLLLGRKLVEFIRLAKRQGLQQVILNTNACLMSPELARGLLDAGVDEIIAGLDACSGTTYEKIRVGGDFGAAVRNVEWVLEERRRRARVTPKVVAQFIVMDENAHEVEAFKDFWLCRGAVVKIRPRLGWGAGVEAKDLQSVEVPRDFPCPWLTRTVSIHWNGRFGQCDADFEGAYSPGDIRTSSIKDLWLGELAARRQKHWDHDFSQPLCSLCRDWMAGRSEFFTPEP